MKAKQFIVEYLKEIELDPGMSSGDLALYHFMKSTIDIWEDDFEIAYKNNDFCRFHKLFRQIDYFENTDLDMCMWHLLHVSRIFWGVVDQEDIE